MMHWAAKQHWRKRRRAERKFFNRTLRNLTPLKKEWYKVGPSEYVGPLFNMPLVRRVAPKLIEIDVLRIQPMKMPDSKLFFIEYTTRD